MELAHIVEYCDTQLQSSNFKDYCPNGLQVQGKHDIRKIVSGVTASLNFIDVAIRAGADLLLVHHGIFWRGDNYAIKGMRYERLKHLFAHELALMAYHLPLDAHPTWGNNAQLGHLLGIAQQSIFEMDNCPIGFKGELGKPVLANDFAATIEQTLHRKPMHIHAGPSQIQRIAWCSGGAQKYIETAIEHGVDAYISGEISEATTHIARENGIHYFAAGHHATERYGVKALGEHLAEQFGVEHEFIDIDNPA